MFRFAFSSLIGVCCCALLSQANAAESQWVQRGTTGRLIYVPDAQGDRIPDFSDVGYQGGKASIPDVPVAATVQPIAGDATSTIQAAIDLVGNLPLGSDGFRGTVLLEAGTYDIGGQLTLNKSGVVLRGVGQNAGGTQLNATGTSQRDLIRFLGTGSQSTFGSTRNLIDKTVPVGATSFRVDVPSDFSAGDTVRITRPSPANWISDLGMDMIPPRSDGGTVNQWQAGSFDLRMDRVVTRVEGDRVFVDAPLTNSFEQQYGGGTIKKQSWGGRIENVGVENLRAESSFASATDEDHSWNFVSVDKAQNVWVRDTTSAHFARSAVVTNPGSKWVTVDSATNLTPKSRITGGRRYSFDLSGQLDLVTNSEANEGRHDFVNNSTRPIGPHVFHNSVANNALDEAGPHQRWATGTLFDNITVDGDQINARNRGNFGTGHGWAGANMVIWNSTAESYIVQNPPTAQNWLVGSTGEIIDDDRFGAQEPGYYDSHNERVEIDSLYESQLEDAADVTEFHWSGQTANWSSAEAWQQKLTPGSYEVESRDYLFGDIDDYVNDGASSVDNAFVDPAWVTAIQSTSALPLAGFDDSSGNKNVAFTLQHVLDAGEQVVHGTLALSLLQSGGIVDTDFIRLFDTAPEHKFALADLGWASQINSTDPFVGLLDLGGFTDELQSGSVNVQLNDDVAVDWALYTVTVARPTASPVGATVFIEGGGQALVDSAINGVQQLSVGGASAGTLAIASTGSLAVDDDYTQLANGVLEIELNSTSGLLSVGGDADLDGLLRVVLDGSYTPFIGNAFDLISTSGQIFGTFADTLLPTLEAGLGWKLDYAAAGVELQVVLAGDYNNDGTVDAADYTLWRASLGSTTDLAADGNNDFVVDEADFSIWRSNYGAKAGDFTPAFSASRTSLAVPEPASAVGLLLMLAVALGGRKRFR